MIYNDFMNSKNPMNKTKIKYNLLKISNYCLFVFQLCPAKNEYE